MLSLNDKKILVTGGFGFIGSHLVRGLLQEGAVVTIISKRIPVDRESAELAKKVTVVIADVSDKNKLHNALSGIECVYHLAASAPFKEWYSHEKSVDDIRIIVDLVKACSTAGVKKIIFLSGHVVYGIPRELPISEAHSTNPINLYGASKLSAEMYLQQLCRLYGLEYVMVRASSCYGPGQASKGAIPNFIAAALEDSVLSVPNKKMCRDYVYVEDAVSALLSCSSVKNKIYNVGGGQSYDLKDVAEMIVSVVGKGRILVQESVDPLENNVLDISLAQRELDFSPRTELKEGLVKHIEWFKQKNNTPTFYLDFDGTLVNIFPRLYNLHKDLCHNFGIKAYSEEDFIELKKKCIPDRELLKDIISADHLEKYLEAKVELLESTEYLAHDSLFSWSVDALNKLREKGQVVLVTRRKEAGNVIRQLKWLGIQNLFDGVLAIGDAGGSKAQLIQKHVSVVSTNSFFIGDTEDDINAGKDLGIKTIAVASGMRGVEFLRGLKPDFVVKDISEVFGLF